MSTQAAVIDKPSRARKQEAILAAATRLFLRAGYGGAAMDAIAREAGVSKQTIYHHFGSKEALFAAIIGDLRERLLAPISPSRRGDEDVRGVLRSLAREFLGLALAPDTIALHRLIVAESVRLPELGAMTYASGPRTAVARLAAYLREQSAAGRIAIADPEQAAERFFAMVLGHFQLRALLCVPEPRPDPQARQRWTERAVDMFLAGHARD